MPNRSNERDVDRILIVDDDPATLLALPALLRTHFPDATIQTAINADVALGWVREYRYRLVLLDVRMPGMNGLAFLGQARASLGAAYIIVMSGSIDEGLRAEAIKAGAHSFFEKPILPETLIETIEALLRG